MAHPAVFVIYGDAAVRDSIRVLLEAEGWPVRDLGSLEAFFQIADLTVSGCLVLEDWTAAPGDGLESLIELRRRDFTLPAIVASGRSGKRNCRRLPRWAALPSIRWPESPWPTP